MPEDRDASPLVPEDGIPRHPTVRISVWAARPEPNSMQLLWETMQLQEASPECSSGVAPVSLGLGSL